jgi:hypothetical protein
MLGIAVLAVDDMGIVIPIIVVGIVYKQDIGLKQKWHSR